MFEKFLHDSWPFILSAITGVAGWLASRPKQKVELESVSLSNVSKALDISETITERLEAQLSKSDEVIAALKDTILLMKTEKDACRDTLAALTNDYRKLQKLHDEQTTQTEMLRADCDKLRALLDNAKMNN